MATQVAFVLESLQKNQHLTGAQFVQGGYLVVANMAALNAQPIYPQQDNDGVVLNGSLAFVYDDPTASNNGFYQYNGTAWAPAFKGGFVYRGNDVTYWADERYVVQGSKYKDGDVYIAASTYTTPIGEVVHLNDIFILSKDAYTANTFTATLIGSIPTQSEKDAWNAKQGALTFDSTPTANSTNPVTSGGIYDAIEDVREIAEGKKNIYVVSDVTNPAFNSQSNSITVSSTMTDIEGASIPLSELHIGDTFYVTETDVPDRWVSEFADRVVITSATGSSSQTGTPTPASPISIVSDMYVDRNYTDVPLRGIDQIADTYANETLTHNIGVYTFTGTEGFDNSASATLANHRVFRNTSLFSSTIPIVSTASQFYCTHFSTQYSSTYTVPNYLTRWMSSTVPTSQAMFCISEAEIGITSQATQGEAVAAFKAWLAAQNTNGTPVQVYYPRNTPTTESLTLYRVGPRTAAILNKLETAKVPVTDVKIGNISVVDDTDNVAKIYTKTAYNASTNKIATESDISTTTLTQGTAITVADTGASPNHIYSVAHGDTSSQSSVTNTGNTVIQSVSLDGMGHVTNLSSKTVATPGTLNTTATTSQSTSSSESLAGSVTLHKVSKTGSYSDLSDKPTIPSSISVTTTDDSNPTEIIHSVAENGMGFTATKSAIDTTVQYNSKFIPSSQAVSNYIASRGENLLTNGTCLLGSNYNFSYFTYDGSDTYYAAGCFKKTNWGSYGNWTNDEFIPVDVNQKYRFDFYTKTDLTGAQVNGMIMAFDIDKKQISSYEVAPRANTLTYLTQELKAGDTVVHFNSIAGWQSANLSTNNSSMLFYGYKNSFGYEYPAETYTKYRYTALWSNASQMDFTDNTITLNRAWTGPTFAVNTKVCQGQDGSGALYCSIDEKGITATLIPGDWEHHYYLINGLQSKNSFPQSQFPFGTAYIKVGLMNRPTGNGQLFKISTMSLSAVSKSTDIGNGTLTIQRNGSTVTTFKANQSSNAVANISVPTSMSGISGWSTAKFIRSINGGSGSFTPTTKYLHTTTQSVPVEFDRTQRADVALSTHKHEVTASGSVSLGSNSTSTDGVKYVDSVTLPASSGSATFSKGTHTHGFTPSGSVSLGSNTTAADGVKYAEDVTLPASKTTVSFSKSTHTHTLTPNGSVSLGSNTTSADGIAYIESVSKSSYTPAGNVSVSVGEREMEYASVVSDITSGRDEMGCSRSDNTQPFPDSSFQTRRRTASISHTKTATVISGTKAVVTDFDEPEITASFTGTATSALVTGSTTKYFHPSFSGSSTTTNATTDNSNAITELTAGSVTTKYFHPSFSGTAGTVSVTSDNGNAVTGVSSGSVTTKYFHPSFSGTPVNTSAPSDAMKVSVMTDVTVLTSADVLKTLSVNNSKDGDDIEFLESATHTHTSASVATDGDAYIPT